MRNVVIAVSGPSGVGKGTIVKELLKRNADITASVSCTTRQPRRGERDGKDYFFITREEFEKRIQENGFLEYDEHFGNFYGTPRSFVEETLKTKSVILEIDVVGALNAKKLMPDTILIMILPPSMEDLKARLKGRGSETEEQFKSRLERVKYELAQEDKYDYLVVNDDVIRAAAEIEEIIRREKNNG